MQKEEWKPAINDTVDVVKDSNNSWLRKLRRVYGGKIIDEKEHNGRPMFRVRYKAPWGETSGWYQEHQMAPVAKPESYPIGDA